MKWPTGKVELLLFFLETEQSRPLQQYFRCCTVLTSAPFVTMVNRDE